MTRPELERCIQEYGKDIYGFCQYLTCNQQEAEDLYQDTFLKAIESKDKIRYEQNPKSYLLSIALRIWKNRKRKYMWRLRIVDTKICPGVQLEASEKNEGESPEKQLLNAEETGIVRQAVVRLPKRLRELVLLYYMEEMSVLQIAGITGLPEGTVKSRLHQARKRLEKELEGVLDEKRTR